MKIPRWAAISLAALSAPAMASTSHVPTSTHSVQLQHRGTALEVRYAAKVSVQRKQIGMSPPTRMSTVRCIWVANVAVERHMPGVPAPRSVSSEKVMTGSRAGDCVDSRKAIEREVASRHDEVRAHLAAVADRDRRQLVAELDAADALATRD